MVHRADFGNSINNTKIILHTANIQSFLTLELQKDFYKTNKIFDIDYLLKCFLQQLGYVLNNRIEDIMMFSKEFYGTNEIVQKNYFNMKNKDSVKENWELTELHKRKTLDIYVSGVDNDGKSEKLQVGGELVSAVVWLE